MSELRNQKIFVLIEETEHLDRFEKAKAYGRFLANELALKEAKIYLDAYDLYLIQSRAKTIMTQEPVGSDLSNVGRAHGGEFMQIAVYVQATVEFLRGRDFLTHWIGYRKSHKAKGSLEYCRHESAEPNPEKPSEFKCKDCGMIVVPAMFKAKNI